MRPTRGYLDGLYAPLCSMHQVQRSKEGGLVQQRARDAPGGWKVGIEAEEGGEDDANRSRGGGEGERKDYGVQDGPQNANEIALMKVLVSSHYTQSRCTTQSPDVDSNQIQSVLRRLPMGG